MSGPYIPACRYYTDQGEIIVRGIRMLFNSCLTCTVVSVNVAENELIASRRLNFTIPIYNEIIILMFQHDKLDVSGCHMKHFYVKCISCQVNL